MHRLCNTGSTFGSTCNNGKQVSKLTFTIHNLQLTEAHTHTCSRAEQQRYSTARRIRSNAVNGPKKCIIILIRKAEEKKAAAKRNCINNAVTPCPCAPSACAYQQSAANTHSHTHTCIYICTHSHVRATTRKNTAPNYIIIILKMPPTGAATSVPAAPFLLPSTDYSPLAPCGLCRTMTMSMAVAEAAKCNKIVKNSFFLAVHFWLAKN